MTRPAAALSLAVASLALAGCVYRMSIQQGNYLDPAAVAQLSVGMTRSQVRYLLGTPQVPEAFDVNRWDYLYYLRTKRLRQPEARRLTVHFVDDKVARIEKDNVIEPLYVPKDTPAAASADAAPATG